MMSKKVNWANFARRRWRRVAIHNTDTVQRWHYWNKSYQHEFFKNSRRAFFSQLLFLL